MVAFSSFPQRSRRNSTLFIFLRKKRFKIDFDIWYNLYRIKVVTSRVGAAEDVQMRSEHSIDGFHRKQGILAAVE